MKYLKSFIIGASFPVSVLFYILVYDQMEKIKKKNPAYYNEVTTRETPFLWSIIWPENYKFYTYFRYTLQVPIFFGILNIISLVIANHFKLSLRIRFITIGIISWFLMMIRQTINNIYNFKTRDQYIRYYLIMFVLYMFIWNIVIYNLEKNL